MTALALVLALAAALCYALAAALQQHAAGQSETAGGMRLVAHLAGRPRWLAGVAAMVAGGCLHVMALRLGPLAVVQPLGATALVFALPLGAALHGSRVGRSQLLAAVAVCAGLVGLLASLRIPVQTPTASFAHLAALAGATGAVVLLCALLGRLMNERARAVVFAVGAGVAFGVTSALARLVAVRAGEVGLLPALLDWPTVLLIAAAGAGMALSQSAYQVGSLSSVLPTVTVVDPLAAVLAGQLALHEPLALSTGGSVVAGAGVAAVVAGTFALARSRMRSPADPSATPAPLLLESTSF
jgi:drug/metabolite transporter (DMT)-like permease